MKHRVKTISLAALAAASALTWLPPAAADEQEQKLYRWVDEQGIVHYGDSVPARYADADKQILNEHGITIDVVSGKKTEEELAEERRQAELEAERERQRRQDRALLATYLSVEEIIMHRDRRVELFQAQARVTELYLRNLQRRLEKLQQLASRYRPYSEDPNAEMIDPALSADIADTREAIARHQKNLQRFKEDEQSIVASFNTDIDRFKMLKGLE
ncbi:MAG TPA: DUF4124 domain-containing protein [Woeseiaceae bacterium]|nr:DUF4124 domain-containing protein [Woeseiaceae bacterium]